MTECEILLSTPPQPIGEIQLTISENGQGITADAIYLVKGKGDATKGKKSDGRNKMTITDISYLVGAYFQ